MMTLRELEGKNFYYYMLATQYIRNHFGLTSKDNISTDLRNTPINDLFLFENTTEGYIVWSNIAKGIFPSDDKSNNNIGINFYKPSQTSSEEKSTIDKYKDPVEEFLKSKNMEDGEAYTMTAQEIFKLIKEFKEHE